MPAGSNQTNTTIPLQDAIRKLARYYGLYTVRDLTGRIALARIQGQDSDSSFDLPQPPEHISRIIELLIDTSVGGYTTADIVGGINRLMTDSNNNQNVQNAVNELVHIIFGPGDTVNTDPGSNVLRGSRNGAEDSVQHILGVGGPNAINAIPSHPSRARAPGLSAILMNSIRVLPIHKNVNAVTVFLNGVPTLELSRAVPYLDINFQLARPPVDGNDQIQGMGLIKFLDGAAVSSNGTRRLLVDANLLTGSRVDGSNEQFTLAGMELFTAPQTMVNADEHYQPNLRSAPVQDNFRPFMTFKSLNVDVQPTAAAMCFKTAKMDFVLHDKTRLAEIADFIRPDLYSNTEILLEYGWSHPDPPQAGNPYADLINGMRCKEKYGIINVSMNFDEAGQVNVSLNMAMRGANDFRTETISTNENGVGSIMRSVRELSSAVGEIRRRVFQNRAPGTREVRGIQILDAAGDANGQLLLTPQLRQELANFRAALRSTNNPNVRSLLSSLDQLYGTNGQGGQVNTLRSTIQRNIAQKLQQISSGGLDIFSANPTPVRPEGRAAGVRFITYDTRDRLSMAEADRELRSLHVRPTVTLGRLLLAFVGQPLAQSGKFDDIQMIFYPFNQYAGHANSLNIANFEVDTRYFLQQYTRYRMESAARAANMTLADFITFISNTLIEDSAARSYGLHGPAGRNFWRTVNNRETGGSEVQSTEADSVALQTRIETVLRGVTPDGSFRLPQLDYYIECVPRNMSAIREGEDNEGASATSILRVHIFDRNTTSYDTQAALLEANRDEELRSIAPMPERTGGNAGVRNSQAELGNAIIQAANNFNLIEQVPGSNPAIYRIRGGPARLKEFMMKTSPYILVGAQGTAVKSAALATQQDPQLATVNLLRSFHADPMEPNGESPGGLPLQVIPCEISVASIGCPLVEFMTKFFVDFGTNTTVDNYYYVTGISHKFEVGSFTTDIKLSPYDGWGRYRSLLDTIRNAQTVLADIQSTTSQTPAGAQNGTGRATPGRSS